MRMVDNRQQDSFALFLGVDFFCSQAKKVATFFAFASRSAETAGSDRVPPCCSSLT